MSDTGTEALSDFGARLRYLRKLAGFTRQADLAEAAGLEKMAVSRAENTSKFRPQIATTEAILEALHKRIVFDEVWVTHGVGQPPNVAATDAIGRYLQTEFGRDTPPDIARRLRLLPWDTLGHPTPTPKQIHRMRDLIEQNLRDG